MNKPKNKHDTKPEKITSDDTKTEAVSQPVQKKHIIILKNRTIIHGIPFEKGSQVEITPEIRILLKPFGYFKS